MLYYNENYHFERQKTCAKTRRHNCEHIWKRISNSKKNVKKIVSECFKSFRDSRREVYVVCMHEYK